MGGVTQGEWEKSIMGESPCLVWLPVDHRLLGSEGQQMPYAVLGDKYARAVKQGAQAQPVLFPLAEPEQIAQLLAVVDGVMLTGSPSNVHPSHYDEVVADLDLPLDPARDALTLALVRACVDGAVPLLGLCRGFQEMNVAMGGSLHQKVQELPGMLDHREPPGQSPQVMYGASHLAHFEPDSAFARWAGGTQASVNSLHSQGVNRLAPGLRALGRAPDGLVEAFAIEGARAFAYAVQWHPEWGFRSVGLDGAIFAAFGESCRARRQARLDPAAYGNKRDPWRT
jgi:putative glutamine amidotransferase